MAAAAKAYANLIASIPARRRRSAAQRGIPREDRDSYRLAILPFNTARPSALPRERRDAFEAHLRSNITKAREQLAAGVVPTPPTAPVRRPDDGRSEAEFEAERKLLGAGCAACRGQCCHLGGNHAFNEVNTMMLYLQRFPTHDDETIVSRYLSYLAPRTLSRGCVYQEEGGCSLPRDLRSDVCNRFYCTSIRVLRNQFAAGEPVRAYFLQQRDGRLVGDRFVEIPVEKE
jgi:hypothetical protein